MRIWLDSVPAVADCLISVMSILRVSTGTLIVTVGCGVCVCVCVCVCNVPACDAVSTLCAGLSVTQAMHVNSN